MLPEVNKEVPSIQDWRELYKAALELKSLRPWDLMRDVDMFGVQNPVDGETGYCCFLGSGGEIFGMVVYLGSEGLEGYLKVQRGEVGPEDQDALHYKKCLLVTFDDKRYVEKQDLEVIKNAGLEFKGKNSWPVFRSYRPGFFPWYLTKQEADFFILCLQQAQEMFVRFRENPGFLVSPDGESYLVRTREDSEQGARWKDSRLQPVFLRKVVLMAQTIDKGRIENIKKISSPVKQTWEVDYFYSPACIAEKGERPYYPLILFFVDSDSFFIINAHMTTSDKYKVEFCEQFLKAIEAVKVIPAEIQVRKEELCIFFERLAAEFGIKVRTVKNLRAVDDVRRHMEKSFGRQRKR
ncbi:MAG: hypothetical protein WC450_08520 [Candidatus Omnitrophota bacterium]|jgi:hypothetical protein